jgi:hypothetical protein
MPNVTWYVSKTSTALTQGRPLFPDGSNESSIPRPKTNPKT